jgi:hypothetical protein
MSAASAYGHLARILFITAKMSTEIFGGKVVILCLNYGQGRKMNAVPPLMPAPPII